MIVRNVARGRSFTKLTAYLTQPKEGHHRALWHSVENVGSTDPKTAAKIMAFVDLHADELKAAAGVKAGGRKAKDGPVYHVVMSWAEGQQPEQAHQLQAARDMLKTVGLDQAQALIVAHDDNGKSHLHIMVNLVDPETGKRFSLSNDRHRMQEWALAYERKNGGVIIERRADKAEKWAKGEPQDKAEAIPRAAMDKAAKAQRRAWSEIKAERDAAYNAQREERDALRADHSAQWATAKQEAAAHKAAYKAAFRAAYAREKAAAKIVNKPVWGNVFKRQKAERAAVEQASTLAKQRADRAGRIASKAVAAVRVADRRSRSLIGKAAQRVGLMTSPEQARARQQAAAEQMHRAAMELGQAELAKAGLTAKHEAERKAIGARISESTFAKAQLAVDTMPRADFAAMIRQQNDQRAAMIERHNATRAALGMKPYEPRPPKQPIDPKQHGAAPMTPAEQMQRKNDQARQGFTKAADRRQTQAQAQTVPVQGTARPLTPMGKSYGNTPAAPDKAARDRMEAQRAAEDQSRTTFKLHDVKPQRADDVKPRTLAEIKAERAARGGSMTQEQRDKAAADFAKATRKPLGNDNSRDDFGR